MTIERVKDDAPAHLYDAEVRALRDKFAGQALIGASANPGIFNKFQNQGRPGQTLKDWLAPLCYEMADAMLAARAK